MHREVLLRRYAAQIHARYGKPPSGAWKAARKLVVAPRFRLSDHASEQVGWKKGELIELAEALIHRDRGEVAYEVADVVYYAAQAPLLVRFTVRLLLRILGWPWDLGLRLAVSKYRLRAQGVRDKTREKQEIRRIIQEAG